MIKQIFVFCLFLGLSYSMQAQIQVQEIDPVAYTYCELVGVARGFSNKVTVEIDYGQEARLFSRDQRIVDRRTGKPKVFNSMIDAMNGMGEIGWEFVQAYVVYNGSSSEIHYILKMAITDENQKDLVPKIKKDVRN